MATTTLTVPGPATRTGRLKEGTLLEVLRELSGERATGVLRLKRDGEHSSLRLVNGQVVSGSSGVRARLGEILVRCGVLGQTELEQGLAKARAEGRRLGPVLVELGFVSCERLEDALRLQVRDVLFAALSWRDGTWELTPDDAPTPLPEDATLRLSTPQLLLESVGRLREPETVRRLLGDLDLPLGPADAPPLRLETTTLGPADGYVLSRADGSLTARQILEIAPLPADEVARSLGALLAAGVIEWRTRPAPAPAGRIGKTAAVLPADQPRGLEPAAAPLPGAAGSEDLREEIERAFEGLARKDHFGVLGLPRTSSPEQVKAAYFALVRRFHPDALGDTASAELEEKARAVFVRVTDAYKTLRGTSSRARYEELLDRAARPSGLASKLPVAAPSPAPAAPPTAAPEPAPVVPPADALRTAEDHLASGRLWEASLALEEVLGRSRGRVRQRAHLLLARAFAKSPSGSKRAEAQLRALLAEDPGCVEGYLALGRLYREKGLLGRAEAMFRQVLSLEPRHPRAAQELGTLAPAPCGRSLPDPRGLLNRLVARLQ